MIKNIPEFGFFPVTFGTFSLVYIYNSCRMTLCKSFIFSDFLYVLVVLGLAELIFSNLYRDQRQTLVEHQA